MTQHFTDTQDTARLLADAIADVESQLHDAKDLVRVLYNEVYECQRELARERRNVSFLRFGNVALLSIILALSAVLAGYM